METYELFLNEEINKGVFAISLVNDPAMESNWVTLSKNVKLAVVDEEKQILMGVALIPDKLIPREDGESVFFSEKTVRQASELFFKNGFHKTATLEHSVNLKDTTVVESWIKEDDVNDKSVKFGIEAPLGSWIISMKVEDEKLFKMAKDGIIKGFSIEGGFSNMLVKNKKENKENDLTKKISAFFINLIKKIEFESKVKSISKWQQTVVNDTFEVGEIIIRKSDFEGENDKPLDDGEYELENGDTIQVDSDGKIVLKTPKNNEMSKETIELSKHEAKVTELEASIETNKTEYEEKAVELNKKIDELTNDKTTLESDKEELKEKNVKLQKDLDEKPDAIKVEHSKKGKVILLTKADRIAYAIKQNKNG